MTRKSHFFSVACLRFTFSHALDSKTSGLRRGTVNARENDVAQKDSYRMRERNGHVMRTNDALKGLFVLDQEDLFLATREFHQVWERDLKKSVDYSNPENSPTMNPIVSGSSSFVPTLMPTIVATNTMPTLAFDLQNCDSYGLQWLLDLADTCVPKKEERRSIITSNFTDCECELANELFDTGVITCEDACPDDCVPCQSCFTLRCGAHASPSLSPAIDLTGASESPIFPTAVPVKESPTPTTTLEVIPTVSPAPVTAIPTISVPSAFDLQECESYGFEWLIELATTCVLREQRVVYTANYTNCECESANKLFDEGFITCDDVCPDDCVACNSCFELRCDLNTTPPATTNSETTNPETNDRESSGSTENGNESENLDDNSTRVFDLSNCSSYAVPWLADLAQTCEDPIALSTLTGCDCLLANEMFQSGMISCQDVCPDNCDVCETCFELICSETAPSFSPTPSNELCDKWTWHECLSETGKECKRLIRDECPDLKIIEIVPENSLVTSDYRLDRVRIFVNDAGIVVDIPRVG